LSRSQSIALVTVITAVFLAGGIWFATLALKSLNDSVDPPASDNSAQTVVGIVRAVLAGAFTFGSYPLADIFKNWLDNLWPSVEFRIGRHYVTVEARRRKRAYATATVLILPFLVAVLASLALLPLIQ